MKKKLKFSKTFLVFWVDHVCYLKILYINVRKKIYISDTFYDWLWVKEIPEGTVLTSDYITYVCFDVVEFGVHTYELLKYWVVNVNNVDEMIDLRLIGQMVNSTTNPQWSVMSPSLSLLS